MRCLNDWDPAGFCSLGSKTSPLRFCGATASSVKILTLSIHHCLSAWAPSSVRGRIAAATLTRLVPDPFPPRRSGAPSSGADTQGMVAMMFTGTWFAGEDTWSAIAQAS